MSARRDRETYRLKIGAEPRSSDSTHPSAPLMRVQEPSCEGPRDHRGQLDAGFVLERMFEDTRRASHCYPLSEYIPFVAPRAVRLR